jgi:hypothetical protein
MVEDEKQMNIIGLIFIILTTAICAEPVPAKGEGCLNFRNKNFYRGMPRDGEIFLEDRKGEPYRYFQFHLPRDSTGHVLNLGCEIGVGEYFWDGANPKERIFIKDLWVEVRQNADGDWVEVK